MTEERVFAELESDAATLHESIRMHLERNFAPDACKHLRGFSSTEAAEFLGLAPGCASSMLKARSLTCRSTQPKT
jgi:chromosome partitioning protein